MLEDLFSRLAIMYAIILSGIVMRRLASKRIDAPAKMLSRLLISILVPLVIFSSTVQFSITLMDSRLILLSSSVFLFSSILAYVFMRMLRLRGGAVGPFVLNSINANELYLPLPIVYALYSTTGMAYSTLFLLIFNMATALYFIPLYSYYSDVPREKGAFLKSVFLFPPFVASIIGLALLGLGFTMPTPLVQPMSYISQATTYLALLFVGINIRLEGNNWLSKPILGVAGIRLILSPLIIFGLLKLLNLSELWGAILIIHAGMPPAVNNILFTDYFNLDRKLTATIVAETTVLTLATLPMLIFLGGIL